MLTAPTSLRMYSLPTMICPKSALDFFSSSRIPWQLESSLAATYTLDHVGAVRLERILHRLDLGRIGVLVAVDVYYPDKPLPRARRRKWGQDIQMAGQMVMLTLVS